MIQTNWRLLEIIHLHCFDFLSDITPRRSPNSLKMICEWMDDYSYFVATNTDTELCLRHSQHEERTADLASSDCARVGGRLLQPDTRDKITFVSSLMKTCE